MKPLNVLSNDGMTEKQKIHAANEYIRTGRRAFIDYVARESRQLIEQELWGVLHVGGYEAIVAHRAAKNPTAKISTLQEVFDKHVESFVAGRLPHFLTAADQIAAQFKHMLIETEAGTTDDAMFAASLPMVLQSDTLTRETRTVNDFYNKWLQANMPLEQWTEYEKERQAALQCRSDKMKNILNPVWAHTIDELIADKLFNIRWYFLSKEMEWQCIFGIYANDTEQEELIERLNSAILEASPPWVVFMANLWVSLPSSTAARPSLDPHRTEAILGQIIDPTSIISFTRMQKYSRRADGEIILGEVFDSEGSSEGRHSQGFVRPWRKLTAEQK